MLALINLEGGKLLAALIGTIVLYYMCYFSLRDENKN